jgi:hypothetical protein
MDPLYKYTWKRDVTDGSDRGLTFTKPLPKDGIFVNLRTGEAHRVFAIFTANENDRERSDLPEDVVQTFPADPLSQEQLEILRRQCEFSAGHPEYVILP